LVGTIKLATNARAKNADLPNIGRTPVGVSNEPAGLPFLMEAGSRAEAAKLDADLLMFLKAQAGELT
jgi:hypothetical protein